MEVKNDIESHRDEGYTFYTDSKGYELMIGAISPYPIILLNLVLGFALSLLVIPLISRQNENGINNLYYSSYYGKKKLNKINLIIFFSIMTVSVIILLTFHIFKIWRFYPEILSNISIDNVLPTKKTIGIWPFILWLGMNIMIFQCLMIALSYFLASHLDQLLSMAIAILVNSIFIGIYIINPNFSPIFLLTTSFINSIPTYITQVLVCFLIIGILIKNSSVIKRLA